MNLLSKRTLFIAGLGLGLLAAVLAYFGNPANMAFCIACFIRDIAGATGFHNAEAVMYVRPEIAGLVIGAFVIAICTKEYKSTAGSSPVIRFVLGIVTMIGALVFLGCPLRMIIRMAGGDLNAYVALVGFVLGVGVGCLFLKKGFSLGRAYETKAANGVVLMTILIIMTILSVATTILKSSVSGPGSQHAPMIISLIVGVLFGAIAQRARTCFAGSIRDIFLMKNFDLFCVIAGLFVAMTVYNLITGNFLMSFEGQPVAHSEHIWNVLGMFVVGLSCTLAGGCPLRQLMLAGQGSSDSAIYVIGLFVGAAICHNYGLASSGAGTTPAGRIACLVCIVIALVIGFACMGKRRISKWQK